MMKLLFVLLAILPLSAFAQSTSLPDITQTYFDQIAGLYENGSELKVADYANTLTAGRCFPIKDPNRAAAAYFVVSSPEDVGPIARDIYEGFIRTNPFDVATVFDGPSFTINHIDVVKDRLPFLRTDSRTWILNYGGGLAASLRVNGTYVVSMVIGKGENYACYFFLKK